MDRIGVRELRQHASTYLSLVKEGKTVEVTERGRLIALLIPPDPARSARERHIGAGRLTPASRPFRLPEPHVAAATAVDSGQILDALREDRL